MRKRISDSMVSSAMSDKGFRQTRSASGNLLFEKHHSSVVFSPKAQAIVFHSSFCPFPWELFMDHGSFGEMESLQANLLSGFKRQGIQMRKLQSSEFESLYRQGEQASASARDKPTN